MFLLDKKKNDECLLFWMDYNNLSVYFWYVYGDELLFF